MMISKHMIPPGHHRQYLLKKCLRVKNISTASNNLSIVSRTFSSSSIRLVIPLRLVTRLSMLALISSTMELTCSMFFSAFTDPVRLMILAAEVLRPRML